MKYCLDCGTGNYYGYQIRCINCHIKATEQRMLKKHTHSLVNQAVKTGQLKKPAICEVCDRPEKLEGHHADYNYPLDVIWACRKCHKNIHRYCEVIYA